MITLFLSPSCTSCPARAWLNEHDVKFQEHNIVPALLVAMNWYFFSVHRKWDRDIIQLVQKFSKIGY